MTGTGIGFDFSQLMAQFNTLDSQLRSLTVQGEAFGKSMRDMIKGLSEGKKLQGFIDQLTNLRYQIVGHKGKKKGEEDIFGFGKQKMLMNWDSTSLQNYINEVNKLIQVIKAVQNEGKGAGISTKGLQITGLRKEVKEAQELLAIIKKIEQQQKRSSYDRNTSYAGATNYSNNAVSIEQNAKAVEYLIAARNKLKTTDADYLTKLEDLNTRIEKHEKVLRRSKQTNKEAAEESRKTAEEMKRANDQMLRTPSQLVGMKGTAKTVNELRLYAEQLRKTMNTLNPKSAEWQKLNGILQQTEKQLSRVENKMKGINGISGTLKNALSGVGRMFATAFAVERVWQYSKAIVSVTGEFEQMQVALRTIIGNIEAANDIWNQTMELARNSPFQARELIRYTRQLAAYRIESDKLYDTTKMLADVSAGLGVDMSRLILAYGQVRAAEYLRGTELRQFTEAGVPMLEELAKHFTELEGVAVSTADAFEMISKRQVAFSDVSAVLEKMTSEGGPFYKMQEVMSNTVKGSISNLKDEVDLMMYEIGQDNDGIIKGFINLLRTLVKNWRYVAAAIKTVTVALVSYTLATKAAAATSFVAGLRITSFARAMVVARTAIRTATASVQGFFAALGPIGWAVVAISTLATAFFSFRSASEEIDEAADRAQELEQELENIDRQYNDINKSIRKYRDAFDEALSSGNLTEMEVQLTRMIELAKEEYSIVFDIQVKGASEEELKTAMEHVEHTLNEASIFGRQFQTKFEYYGPDGEYKGFDVDFKKLEKDLLDEWDRSYTEIKKAVKTLMDNADEDIASLFHEYKAGEDPLQYMYDYYYNLLSIQDNVTFEDPSIYTNPQYIGNILTKFKDIAAAREKMAYNLYLQMGGGEDAWGKNISTYLAGALTNLISRNQIDERALASWKEALKTAFGVDSIDVTLDDGMQEWETDFNKFLEERWETTKKAIETANLTSEASLGDSFRLNGVVVKALDEDNAKTRPELAKTLKESRDIQKEIIDAVAAGSEAYTEAEAKIAQIKFDQYDALIKWLEGNQGDSSKGKNKLEEANKKRIELLKKMNSQYLNEFKTFGDEAEPEIRDAYEKAFGEVFKGTNIKLKNIDFASKSGLVAALESLRPYAQEAGKDAVDALETEIAKFKGELKIEAKKDQYQETLDEIQKLFNQYELTLELKKLNISEDLAKALFGEEYLGFDALKDKTKQEFIGDVDGEEKVKALTEQINKGLTEIDWNIVDSILGPDQAKELKKRLEELDKMEDKLTRDRMAKYIQYSRDSLGEMAKIRMEQIQKMVDIDEAFKPKDGDSKEVADIKRDERTRAMEKAKSDADEALAKLEWDNFRKSETFTSLMDDLSGASDDMLKKAIEDLEAFKKQWEDLPIDQMQEVVKLINKAKRAQDSEDSPWAEAKRLRGNIREDGRTREQAELDSYNAEIENARLQEELQMIELIQQQRNAKVADETIALALGSKYVNLLGKEVNLTKRVDEITDKIGKNQTTINNAQDRIQDERDLVKQYEKQKDTLDEISGMASNLYDSFKGLYEAVGGDGEDAVAVFADMGMQMLTTVLQTFALKAQLDAAAVSATGFGAAMNAAMGIIGWIVMAVQLITAAITAIAKVKDNKLAAIVDEQKRKVEELQKVYEQLEEALDEAWNVEDVAKYNREIVSTTESMITAQKAAIAAQKQRKKANKEGSDANDELKEMEAELEEMEKNLAETLKDSFSKVTDGILDNVFDAAKEFTDAWYDAFKETGDGLSGLEENFEEMFMNLAKNQAAMQITGAFTEQWKEALKDYINDEDTELTKEDAASWAEEVRSSLPELNAALEAFLGTISEGLGGKSGSLSELQKGIQGITEDTAQVLESLINSMRLYVADTNNEIKNQTTYIKRMWQMMDNAVNGSSPFYVQMKTI